VNFVSKHNLFKVSDASKVG